MMKEDTSPAVIPPSVETILSSIYSEFFLNLNSYYSNFLESQKSFFRLQNPSVFSNFLNNKEEFTLVTIEEHNRMEKVNASLILCLLNENFPFFSQFTKEEKKHFFGPFAARFINLHRCYLTAKYFPDDKNKVVSHYGYYAQRDIEGFRYFYGDVPDLEKLTDNMLPALDVLRATADKMVQLNLIDEEIGGLIGLMYYNQCE